MVKKEHKIQSADIENHRKCYFKVESNANLELQLKLAMKIRTFFRLNENKLE